jgi:hypothetical protein
MKHVWKVRYNINSSFDEDAIEVLFSSKAKAKKYIADTIQDFTNLAKDNGYNFSLENKTNIICEGYWETKYDNRCGHIYYSKVSVL